MVFVKLSDGGTVNLLSRSYGVYNINELGLQKCTSSPVDETDGSEKTYKCASHEMRIFGAIGSGASSVVQRAIHIPNHRILALKKINIFEKVLFLLCFVALYWYNNVRVCLSWIKIKKLVSWFTYWITIWSSLKVCLLNNFAVWCIGFFIAEGIYSELIIFGSLVCYLNISMKKESIFFFFFYLFLLEL